MSNQTAVREHTGFELYLEGVKIPTFNNVTIRENEGTFPQASISFPASSGILRTLPGTVVQIFGPDPRTGKKILIFEGEIIGEGYQKNEGGRIISFQCSSFLHQWRKATATPKDSIQTPEWRDAQGQKRIEYVNATSDEEAGVSQAPNHSFAEIEKALKSKLETEVYDRLDEMMENIDLTQTGQFADEFVQLLEKEEIRSGDIHLFVLFLLKKFELHDPYYGMVANSLGVESSISTWPNADEKLEPFKLKSAIENTLQFAQSMQQGMRDGSLNLMTGVRQLLQTIHYTLIAPSNYTGSYQFWSQRPDATQKRSPVRGYFTPNLEQSPPAMFNVLFPHHIKTLSYNRKMMNEPTRTIGQLSSNFYGQMGYKGIRPFCTEPMLNLTHEGAKNNRIGLTPEETYRGINAMPQNFDQLFANSVEDLDEEEEFKEKVNNPLNQMTIERHYQNKLRSRTVNVSAEWSPYRMTGVPGAIIEKEDGPSMTGVISSISTSISGAGHVSSTITFRAVRVMHDLDDLNHPEYENMVNDFVVDPYINSNPFLFDPKIYDFENVGFDLYTFLRWGTLSSEGSLKEYIENGDVFKDSQGRVSELDLRSDDNSILSVLRNDEGDLITEISVDLISSEELDEDFPRSAKLTRNVYEAIRTIEDTYNGIDNGDLAEKWANEFTYRDIISKANYFSYIGIDPMQPIDRDLNYKDGFELFTGTELTDHLQKTIETFKKDANPLHPNHTTEEEIKLWEYLSQVVPEKRKRIKEINNRLSEGRLLPGHIIDLKDERDYLRTQLKEGDVAVTGSLFVNKGLEDELARLEEKYGTLAYEESKDSADIQQFEKKAFRVYNLTRRAHVKVGFNKYIQKTLNSDSDQLANSSVNENLNIIT